MPYPYKDAVFRDPPSLERQEIQEITDEFDPIAFISYVRLRWRAGVVAAIVAIAIAFVGSLILPNRYTAKASILIEPPAGNDPRAATAVSPVYLESLKTYESFASSDTLFAQAVKALKLRGTDLTQPVETLKRRILRVSKPRDTKILEISATLGDPTKAQALAEYIAKETVGLSKTLDERARRELTEQARQILDAASARVDKAVQMRSEFLAANPIAALEDETAAAIRLQSQIQTDLTYARSELAEYEAQAKLPTGSEAGGQTAASIPQAIASTRAKISVLDEKEQSLEREGQKRALVLEHRKHERESLELEFHAARALYEQASTKNSDILSSASFRGERLEIIDPGIVPERPSFPNLPLNVFVAFSISILGWLCYVALSFSYSRTTATRIAQGKFS